MKLTIESAENGFLIKGKEDCNGLPTKWVTTNDLDGQKEMFFTILEYFGLSGNRHDKERLAIKIEHGEKYECEGCEICSE